MKKTEYFFWAVLFLSARTFAGGIQGTEAPPAIQSDVLPIAEYEDFDVGIFVPGVVAGSPLSAIRV